MIIAGREERQSLVDVVQLLKNTSNPQVDHIIKVMKKWAKDNRISLWTYSYLFKVEKILKGSLDLIPSPSVKIQIMGGKVCLRVKVKTLLGIVNKLVVFKSLLTTPSNVLPLHLKQTFLANNLNFHWRWWNQIQATF